MCVYVWSTLTGTHGISFCSTPVISGLSLDGVSYSETFTVCSFRAVIVAF